ncbi:hypothetical protein DVVG_00025 [Dunaliella viridis virus SI2]|uniref:hypothetical protein n=1 Tax=Dunaliella viridis virus SI2 TaxID=754069 RepID=UPI0002C13C4E|nr:hypothetical protein DVVG_00025 [Dunaliella viridis virus SI2]AGH16011.1 hypothetical protein DVVG_00025 [Dunaliella viridis virus SI2]
MSTLISIHPQYRHVFPNGARMAFHTDGKHVAENSNAVTLEFKSAEYHAEPLRIASGELSFLYSTNVSVFGLSDTDAEILSSVGMLDEAHRRELLPILRHMLDDQKAEAAVAAEGANA